MWSDLPWFKSIWKDWLIYFVLAHIVLAWIFGIALLLRWLAS